MLTHQSPSSSSSTTSQDDAATPASTDSPTSIDPSSSSSSSSSRPPNFPLGSYSLVTFLDTVLTDCTANSLTWSCYPYTDYYTSNSKSVSTFNWVISGTKGAYKISSTENPFSISFKNANLELLNEGEDNERYRFLISTTKTVSPATNLTDDNASVDCDYTGNLQANLYTKMTKEYPSDQDPTGDPSYTPWPYAVKIEQSASGGQSVPNCYKTTSSGQHGDAVTEGLEAQDRGSMCSCLYRNWYTPRPQ